MDKHRLFSKRNGIVAALVAIIVFILIAFAQGVIGNGGYALASWLWGMITQSLVVPFVKTVLDQN